MPGRILGHPDETPGQLSLEPGSNGHVAGVRATEAHRHTKALARADCDIRSQFARGGDEGEGEQVGRDHRKGPGSLRCGNDGTRIPDTSGTARVLHEDAERSGKLDRVAGELRQIENDQLDTHRGRAVLEQSEGLRQCIRIDDEGIALDLRGAPGEHHALDDCGALVEH